MGKFDGAYNPGSFFLQRLPFAAKPGMPAKLSGHAPALRLRGEAKQGDQHRLVPGHGPFPSLVQ